MNNYQYLNRDPQVGDLILWTDIANPEATNRTAGKSYLVTEILDNELIMIVNDIGNKRSFGTLYLKILKTKPASEAKVGDIMYRIEGGEGGEFPLGSTKPITKITKKYEKLNYSSMLAANFEEVLVLDQTPDYELGKTNIKIQVNEQQSKTIQEICFDNGITWEFAGKKLSHTLKDYLYISNFIIHGKTQRYFNLNSAQEIDAEEFINKYKGATMQTFTKADLKTGMMVETEEGNYGLVLGNAILWCAHGKGGTPLNNISYNLYSDSHRIIKVYAERKDASGSDLIYKAENPHHLIGDLIYEVPVQKNQVEVSNAGDSNRTIYINRETPDLIHIGCFTGTFQEAVNAILDNYLPGTKAAQYIAKVSECFKLAEKEFKD